MKPTKKRTGKADYLPFINICVVVLALVVVGVLALVLPKPTVSEIEKRELAKKPQWTLSSWFSGAFAKEYDAYYADTFPQRENFVSVATKLEQMRGLYPDDVRIHQASTPQTGIDQQKPAQQPQQQESQQQIDYDSYTDPNAPGNGLSGNGSAGEQVGSIFLYQNMGMQIFGSSETLSKRYAEVINSYAVNLEGVQVYNLIAPTSIEFYLPEKYQGISSSEKENIEFVNQNLSDKVKPVDAYSEIEKQKDDYIYFRTDHHWTVRGAYAAYIAFCKTAGLEPVPLDEMERHQIDGFVGTFYNQTQDAKLAETPDFVEYFVPPTETETLRYERGKAFDPVEGSIFASYATGGQNTYSVFLHGDFPLTKITTDNHTGRKIMLIKESFGNAFAPFLVSHYDEVYIVDQRYFELGVEDFIKENGITDLLILNNIFAVNTSLRIDELETIRDQEYTPYVAPVVPQPAPSQEQQDAAQQQAVTNEEESSEQNAAQDASQSTTQNAEQQVEQDEEKGSSESSQKQQSDKDSQSDQEKTQSQEKPRKGLGRLGG